MVRTSRHLACDDIGAAIPHQSETDNAYRLLHQLASRQRWFAIFSRRLLFPTIIVAILLFFLLPIATIYSAVTQHTLFVSSGIDEKMATEIPKLLNCDASSGPSSQRLANISTDIIKRGLIKRDLVITGSMLSSNSSSRQSDFTRQAEDETDLYFIYAFNHLFDQAQLLDARSRRQAEIFTLRPRQDPFLCTIEFGRNYIIEAMKWGRSDARDTAIPRFVRQPRPSGL